MALLIDPPAWGAHGRLWSHLISDTSLAELHYFAGALGIPRRAFEGDHYDIPEERYAAVLAAGAAPVPGRDLLAALSRSGLRFPKRKGDKGIERLIGLTLPSGTVADVDLVASPREMDERRVFAAMVFLSDAGGDLVAVHSVRRDQWGSPGGWREAGESVRENAIREVSEETGLSVTTDELSPCGYERWRHVSGPWPNRPGQDVLQTFRATVASVRPILTPSLDDTDDRRWVTLRDYETLCSGEFWWPLADRVLRG